MLGIVLVNMHAKCGKFQRARASHPSALNRQYNGAMKYIQGMKNEDFSLDWVIYM